ELGADAQQRVAAADSSARVAHRTRLRRSAAQIPERARQADRREQRFRLLQRMPPPIGFDLVLVPAVREPPRLLRRDRGTTRQLARLAPVLEMLFIPEEQHRASGEADVVPPVMRRNGEVNDTFAAYQPAVAHLERQRFAAVYRKRADARVDAERGGDP